MPQEKTKEDRRGDVGYGSDETIFPEDLPTTLARVEREVIVLALRAARGNKARAARALGISERLMGLRVKKHAIDPKVFRDSRRS
jgi:Nif-specific regulatory protein